MFTIGAVWLLSSQTHIYFSISINNLSNLLNIELHLMPTHIRLTKLAELRDLYSDVKAGWNSKQVAVKV